MDTRGVFIRCCILWSSTFDDPVTAPADTSPVAYLLQYHQYKRWDINGETIICQELWTSSSRWFIQIFGAHSWLALQLCTYLRSSANQLCLRLKLVVMDLIAHYKSYTRDRVGGGAMRRCKADELLVRIDVEDLTYGQHSFLNCLLYKPCVGTYVRRLTWKKHSHERNHTSAPTSESRLGKCTPTSF